MADELGAVLAEARAALKSGEAHRAARAYERAQELSPLDPEIPHERGLALLETGAVGLAAAAQAQAIALDPEHTGARAQRAAALEALGDDEGAARELSELLRRTGPVPVLQARLTSLGDAARRARDRRLLGNNLARLAGSPLATPLARGIGEPVLFKASFAELRGRVEGARLLRLDLVFDSMDASLGRSDATYGGVTQEDDGRRVPLDEFTAAGIVFLSEALGIEPSRARRMLAYLLTPECGRGPHPLAGCRVGWTISGENGTRKYGLFAEG